MFVKLNTNFYLERFYLFIYVFMDLFPQSASAGTVSCEAAGGQRSVNMDQHVSRTESRAVIGSDVALCSVLRNDYRCVCNDYGCVCVCVFLVWVCVF